MVRNKLCYSLETKVGNDTYQMMFDPDGKVTYDEAPSAEVPKRGDRAWDAPDRCRIGRRRIERPPPSAPLPLARCPGMI
jgi:hypothetical protein